MDLLFVTDDLRRWLAHLELGAHFLDLRGLLFELGCQIRDNGFQFLNFAIEHGLLGGVGNGLGLDALGRKSTRIGSIDRERAQPSIGIDEHKSGRPSGNRRTRDVVDKASVTYLAKNTVHTRVVADDDIVIGYGETRSGHSAHGHVVAGADATLER